MLTDILEYIHEDAEGQSIHIGPYEVRGAAKTGLATRRRARQKPPYVRLDPFGESGYEVTPVNRRPDQYRVSLKDGVGPIRPCFWPLSRHRKEGARDIATHPS